MREEESLDNEAGNCQPDAADGPAKAEEAETVITAPVHLVVNIPGQKPITARVGAMTFPVPRNETDIDERTVGSLIAEFLTSAAAYYREDDDGHATLS